MAVGYSPTPRVYLVHVRFELVCPGENDRCEGFVDLDPVHLVDAQPGLLEHQACGRDDAGQLHYRILTDGHTGHEARPWNEAVGLGHLAVPDEHGRGPISELGGVAGRYDPLPLWPEDRLQTRHLSGVYGMANALVRGERHLVPIGVEAGGGQDLLVLVLMGRRARPPMALGGESIQILARYPPLLGYPFGALALVHEVLPLQEIRVHLEARLAVTGVAEHRRPRHTLRARGDGVTYVARGDGLRDEVGGLLAGAAHAVEAYRWHRYREARQQHAESADIRPLFASLGNGPVYDVLDLIRVQPCALQEPVEGMRQKSVRTYLAEGPASLGERSANRLEDYGLSHLCHGLSTPLL